MNALNLRPACDLEQLEELEDSKTRLLVLNNPANPTGAARWVAPSTV